MNDKLPNNPLPVYIITRTGVGFNDEGIRAVTDLILSGDTSAAGPQGYGIDGTTTGILALSGSHLLNPAVLADNLRSMPTARVIVSRKNDGSYSLLNYGPGPNGLQILVDKLEAAQTHGWDSWRALVRANWPELEEEYYGEA